MGFILAIDQGTTGTTAVLINDSNFKFVDKVNKEFPQIFPQPGQVEHNLNDIWDTVQETVKALLKKNHLKGKDLSAIGITNQRETTCAFSKAGEPLANAIVWQDRRTFDFCQSIKAKESEVQELTGLPIDPYFSGTKMRWLLKNNKQVKSAVIKDDLRLGTIDTFLLYKLSGHKAFATESSNASRTLLMNLSSGKWDESLTKLFEVDPKFLPEIKDSFGFFGETSGLSFLPDGIPISGILGDQQSALFGQAGYSKGDIKCTYGTGAFMLLNTGRDIKRSQNGLLSTVAYQKDGNLTYALEGSCYIAGAAVQWLRDNCFFFKDSPEIETLASKITNLDEMKNILFLPFFTGIGSPHWKAEATGALIGLTRDTSQNHISRACLEGIALSINDLINAMKKDTGLAICELKVDGGAVANNLLMNIQASLSKLNIIRPKVIETTAYGAALAAAIGVGKVSFNEIDKLWVEDKVFESAGFDDDYFNLKKHQWSKAIKALY
ncbi:MAG: glycerol kinase GlpK [Bacteriovoracaceae bacterium]|jgi:glycerol kinase|nr:glycerol kinase GlpK [Bacteriovoracaceae bacterium]